MNEYAVALEHAQIADKVFEDFINYSMNAGAGTPIDWLELNRLARRSNEADSTLKAIMEQVQDEPCTCNPVTGSICGPCWVDNQARYPHIPYKAGE